jgi:hypothetical protein
MISPFHSIISYEENDWEEYLDRILLIHVFSPVIKEYKDKDTLKGVIRFIAYAYSVDSDKIILSRDWKKNKQEIFELVLIKPEKKSYEDLVLLKNQAVVETIHRWVTHQDNATFTHLQVLKDLRVEMQISALSKILKSSGEVDYDQKFRNAKYADDLKKMIKDLESELIQNNQKLKDAVKEVRVVKSSYTVSPATFSK